MYIPCSTNFSPNKVGTSVVFITRARKRDVVIDYVVSWAARSINYIDEHQGKHSEIISHLYLSTVLIKTWKRVLMLPWTNTVPSTSMT